MAFLRDAPGDPAELGPRYRALLARLNQTRSAPDRRRLLGDLGTLARSLGDYPAAIGHFEAALALSQEPGPAAANRTRLGVAMHYNGDWNEAARCFETVLAAPEAGYHDYAHQHLGKLRVDQGRLDEARLCFEAALELRLLKADANLIASTRQALAALSALQLS